MFVRELDGAVLVMLLYVVGKRLVIVDWENKYVRLRARVIYIYIGCRDKLIEYLNSCASIDYLYVLCVRL